MEEIGLESSESRSSRYCSWMLETGGKLTDTALFIIELFAIKGTVGCIYEKLMNIRMKMCSKYIPCSRVSLVKFYRLLNATQLVFWSWCSVFIFSDAPNERAADPRRKYILLSIRSGRLRRDSTFMTSVTARLKYMIRDLASCLGYAILLFCF